MSIIKVFPPQVDPGRQDFVATFVANCDLRGVREAHALALKTNEEVGLLRGAVTGALTGSIVAPNIYALGHVMRQAREITAAIRQLAKHK